MGPLKPKHRRVISDHFQKVEMILEAREHASLSNSSHRSQERNSLMDYRMNNSMSRSSLKSTDRKSLKNFMSGIKSPMFVPEPTWLPERSKANDVTVSAFSNEDLKVDAELESIFFKKKATLRLKGRILLALMNKSKPNMRVTFLRWKIRSDKKLFGQILTKLIIKSKLSKEVAFWRFKWIAAPL